MWKKLPLEDPPRYNSLKAAGMEDKLRYLRDISVYNHHHPDDQIIPTINPPKGYDINGQKANILRSPRMATQIVRAKTAYSIFATGETRHLSDAALIDKRRKVGKHLGDRWAKMDDDEKEMYLLLHQNEKGRVT